MAVRWLRALRRHALPFWRYWNRPLAPDWALGLGAQAILLICSWAFVGGLLAVFSCVLFAAGLFRYTADSARQYRKALRGGGRHEIHDRNDIFRW